MNKIQVLPPEEARKIAAGEVIDRPAALIREFMDNAIDAGSSLVEVSIEGGGIAKVEVSDDGEGMEREDLEMCTLAHATSKIRAMEDLKKNEALGFRGEALAAAAAASRLEIVTSRDGRTAWKLQAGPGGNKPPEITQFRRAKGSSVRSLGVFDSMPARKRFLKREGSEGAACRQIFNEKALAFPGLAFRFIQDGNLKVFYPKAASYKERFIQVHLTGAEGKFVHEIYASGPGFSVVIVAGGPEIYRNDRRLQAVFANGRRINEFSLLQALEYGLQGFFPNGVHPAGAVFIDIDPALADFNIHPAKREARFADPGAIHHAVTAALLDYCKKTFAKLERTGDGAGEGQEGPESPAFFDRDSISVTDDRFSVNRDRNSADRDINSALSRAREAFFNGRAALSEGGRVKYLGHIFDLFIVAEQDGKLYIIDQHAAHERVLYDKFLRGPIQKQELLVPIPFTTESEEDDTFLRAEKNSLEKLGIVLCEDGDGWRIDALPEGWKLGGRETAAEILKLKDAGANMAEKWAAVISCHGAIKDGDYLGPEAALRLAAEAIAIPIQRCPHGRPIWFEISRDDLLKAVRRT